jgi:hypothetical protein
MTLDTVSDILAFVCANSEFTKSILFAEEEVPEIREAERSAIAAVQDHVRQSYLGLLGACRAEMVARATSDHELSSTMNRNWNRDDSVWRRRRVELPLLIQASYVEVAYFWIDEEPTKKGGLCLVGELWVQARRRGALEEVAMGAAPPVFLTPGKNLRIVREISAGTKFAELAREVVEPLWPLAVDIRARLLAGP